MSCSCSGSPGRDSGLPPAGAGYGRWSGPGMGGGGGGIALEPFPRQALVGIAGGAFDYFSPIYDATHWKSVTWWVECYGSLPGVTGLPLTMYLETSETQEGPWLAVATQAYGVADDFSGTVNSFASLIRVRMNIIASEISSMACRIVARPK
jgi:hypothetical protein